MTINTDNLGLMLEASGIPTGDEIHTLVGQLEAENEKLKGLVIHARRILKAGWVVDVWPDEDLAGQIKSWMKEADSC